MPCHAQSQQIQSVFRQMCTDAQKHRHMPTARLTAVVTVGAVDLHRSVHAAGQRQRAAPARPAVGQKRRQELSPAHPGGDGAGAEGQRGGGGVRGDGGGGGGRQAGEVRGNLSDGSDGAGANVNGHVFLDGDAELLSSPHRHRV